MVWMTTILGATELLKLGQIITNVMAYQVGSNDLEEKSPEEDIREIESLILSTVYDEDVAVLL
jgi:hypothetical protein